MSEKYELMETSINFMDQLEQEEYAMTSHHFPQNIIYNNNIEIEAERENVIQDKNVNTEDEEIGEGIIEEEQMSTMRHQEADSIIREEIKAVILKKETEKTSIAVLSQQKNIITENIKMLQNLRDRLGQETEELGIQHEVDREELQYLEERLLYNGKIRDMLDTFTKTISEKSTQLKSENEKLSIKLNNQKKDVLDSKKYWDSKIKSDSDKASRSNANDINILRKENLLLKTDLQEKKERLEKLQQHCQQIGLKKEYLSELHTKQQNLQKVLNSFNEKELELKTSKDQTEQEINDVNKKLQMKEEEYRGRLQNLQDTVDELKTKLHDKTAEYDKIVVALSSTEEITQPLEEKLTQVLAKVKNRQEELNDNIERWGQDDKIWKDKCNEQNSILAEINKEINELTSSLDILKSQYIGKVEEKNQKLSMKFEVEQKLRAVEVLIEKIGQLDKKIEKKEKAVEELYKKMESLSADTTLQVLEKKDAYLNSSKDYLREKLENLEKLTEHDELEVENLEKLMDTNEKLIQEKQQNLADLLKELKNLKSANEEKQRPPFSILKSPSSQKKFAISPKKVKFEGIPSYESTCSDSGSAAVGTSSIAGKSFDELLEDIKHGETFKRPAKTSKKRQLDFD